MKLRTSTLALVITGFLFASPSFAALKRVIITPFYNASKKGAYDYLSKSLTDASRKSLKARFNFSETPQREWESTLRKNHFLYEDDYHSRTVSLQNGLLNKQDLVISGYYEVLKKTTAKQTGPIKKNPKQTTKKAAKKGAKTPNDNAAATLDDESQQLDVIRNHVYLIDVKGRRILSEFSVDSPVDSSIFQSVEMVAGRIAEEAKAILPNKAGFTLGQDSELKLGVLAVQMGANVLDLGENNDSGLGRNFTVYNNDFAYTFRPSVGYRYPDFILENFMLSAHAEVAITSTELEVKSETGNVDASLLGYVFGIGAGYNFGLTLDSYFIAGIGGGYQIADVELDLAALEFQPIDPDGNTVSSYTAGLNSAYVELTGTLGYYLSAALALETGVKYRHYMSEVYNGQFIVQAGFAFQLN